MPERSPTAGLFEPRVALASLSGEADAEWARRGSDHAGAAFLGGVALDEATREAARAMVARDRTEFLPADPLAFVARELDALAHAPIRPGVNVRSATIEPITEVAAICAECDAIVEINAHCRQQEMCDVGCGEALLRDTDRLRQYVASAADSDAAVSVKVRAEVSGVDLAETARAVEAARSTSTRWIRSRSSARSPRPRRGCSSSPTTAFGIASPSASTSATGPTR